MKPSPLFPLFAALAVAVPIAAESRKAPSVTISEAPMQWNTVTLSLEGPFARETDNAPNPFLDFRFDVTFSHESGELSYRVPGYFAANGNAGETSATEGSIWRAHLCPDLAGRWDYRIHFHRTNEAGEMLPIADFDGATGSFEVAKTDLGQLHDRDFRRRGRLSYVGKFHYQFQGDHSYFLKVGADAPETLLAYADFDDTYTRRDWAPIKTYAPHLRDWQESDPVWKNGKGKGLIGALNYLSSAGANGISFIPYNVGGDGRNVWPMVAPEDKLHYDCSKLDQWNLVFSHAQARGLHLHFKLQETENDDQFLRDGERGKELARADVPAALDGGEVGIERKLYFREMVARFGHHLALTWNLGEENTQTTEQQRAMSDFFHEIDPYHHPITLQTFPDQQELVYLPHLGTRTLDGIALQNTWDRSHELTLFWRNQSAKAEHPWVVCHDEQNPWRLGVPPDLGFEGFDGTWDDEGTTKPVGYNEHDIRKLTLWGNFMAGGGGVEYYFGWKLPHADLTVENFRSRHKTWGYGRIAIDFFHDNSIPFQEMRNRNDLVGNSAGRNGLFCLAGDKGPILVYAANASQPTTLDLSERNGTFSVRWFNPRSGGGLEVGSVAKIAGGHSVSLGTPPEEADQDWAIILLPTSQ